MTVISECSLIITVLPNRAAPKALEHAAALLAQGTHETQNYLYYTFSKASIPISPSFSTFPLCIYSVSAFWVAFPAAADKDVQSRDWGIVSFPYSTLFKKESHHTSPDFATF